MHRNGKLSDFEVNLSHCATFRVPNRTWWREVAPHCVWQTLSHVTPCVSLFLYVCLPGRPTDRSGEAPEKQSNPSPSRRSLLSSCNTEGEDWETVSGDGRKSMNRQGWGGIIREHKVGHFSPEAVSSGSWNKLLQLPEVDICHFYNPSSVEI